MKSAEYAQKLTEAQRLCSIDDCEEIHHARGWCRNHYQSWKRHGDPLQAQSLKYSGVHMRLRETRGPATDFDCTRCERPADEWAYTGEDPQARRSREGFLYSQDLTLYEPLCRSCHRRMDARPPTHCPAGHPYKGEHLYIDPSGGRRCRTCDRERQRRKAAAK